MAQKKSALVVGAGAGLSAAMARKLAADGWSVHLAARTIDKLSDLCDDIGARAYACDVSDAGQVAALFNELDGAGASPQFVLFNPSMRVRGPVDEIDPDAVLKALEVSAFGGFLVAQQAVRRMVPAGGGAIFFTGASASVKGYPNSSSFAMNKFALRGLSQSLARELQPKNIHIAHFVIDGGIESATREGRQNSEDEPDKFLKPEAIADTYMAILKQDRSAWSWEVEVRPWVENF